MARPAKPLNVHVLKGTGKSHPDRMRARENEPENINEIGAAPKTLNKIETAAFDEIVKTCIPGVLGEADRIAVEEAARLLIKCRGYSANIGFKKADHIEVVPATQAERTLFAKYLGQFGMTPSERSKIRIEKPAPKNKFDA